MHILQNKKFSVRFSRIILGIYETKLKIKSYPVLNVTITVVISNSEYCQDGKSAV